MKKITAYVNTLRVHWLVEELEALGISEIMVTEYFSPSSKISRMELILEDEAIEKAREIIHRVGTTGEPGDHSIFIEDYDPDLPSQIPLGKRTSKLEESRIKQLVNFLLNGTHRKIRSAFLFIVLSILSVAVFVSVQMRAIEQAAQETNSSIQLLSETTSAVESALLEEMLAVERFHRGESTPALNDFRKARAKLTGAISKIKETNLTPRIMVNALADLEHQFHLLGEGMFNLLRSSSKAKEPVTRQRRNAESPASHDLVMSSLDELRLQLMVHVNTLQQEMKALMAAKQDETQQSTQEVRFSLLVLVGVAIAITTVIWLLVERTVARPIQKLVAESRTIDTMELK
jgi:nitrogen regulatory protein PII/Ca2+/Na+ antiporter